MFAAYRNPSSTYRNLAAETAVQDASPHALIAMLYQGAIEAIVKARSALEQGRVADKGESTTKAIRIVDEGLKAALDRSRGDVAQNLHALYEYITHRLLLANRHNDLAMYDEELQLLRNLSNAWTQIAPPSAAAAR